MLVRLTEPLLAHSPLASTRTFRVTPLPRRNERSATRLTF
jgi:hypothetical protein